MIRRTVLYRGRVQGVGFRWTAVQLARGFQIGGHVRNLADGRVELVAEGESAEVAAFCDALRQRMAGYIHAADASDGPATERFRGFDVAF